MFPSVTSSLMQAVTPERALHHAAQKEEPHAPARRPEAAAGALAHRARVEAVVDQVLQVLVRGRVRVRVRVRARVRVSVRVRLQG